MCLSESVCCNHKNISPHVFSRPGIIPSFLAYSSFGPASRQSYVAVVVLTITLQVVAATVKWIREDKVNEPKASTRISFRIVITLHQAFVNAPEPKYMLLPWKLVFLRKTAAIHHEIQKTCPPFRAGIST